MSLPRVLPAWVSQVSMYLEELDDATANAIALPSAYLMATPERQRAYRVGRVCASRALEQIGVRGAMPAVHENGGPAWPNGTVGSITHAMSLVAAAVAARRQCCGLGIDIEPITSLEKAHSLASRGATTGEVFGVMENLQVDYATAVALILAAKHSLYKCLHPQVGRSFSYLDASIENVQGSTARFRARLKVMLSPAWVGGTIVTGQFDIAGDFVHTGIAIPC
ncbi:MAG: phosphopantetheinyl transferase [Acidobacteria bacterium]|nr:MAG: phosphopantetheinyl transferase [Acidobacteriota bacterium]